MSSDKNKKKSLIVRNQAEDNQTFLSQDKQAGITSRGSASTGYSDAFVFLVSERDSHVG